MSATAMLTRASNTLELTLTRWLIAPDEADTGRAAGWSARPPEASGQPAAVPGYLQQTLPGYHGVVWYWTHIPPADLRNGERAVVQFERVSYRAEVWVNGEAAGTHEGTDGFEIDVTGQCPTGAPALLVVRVLNPTTRRIDGMTLAETPASNSFEGEQFWPGRGYNYGGITGAVRLVRRMTWSLQELHVVADPDRAEVRVAFRVDNQTGAAVRIRWQCDVSAEGTLLGRQSAELDVSAPSESIECTLPVTEPKSWSPDNPYLYDVQALVVPVEGSSSAVSGAAQSLRVRTGFRTLVVDDEGYFVLNGRRILIRSTHTGNHVPAGLTPEQSVALLRRDLLNAKAVGLNMVRFIACRGTPDQLDMCDEIGLMVYEECNAAWPHGYSPEAENRFDAELSGAVRRDRNHPSVVVWGLLNETREGPIFRRAADSLPMIRELDTTRLVLLGSGRWDGDLSVGSVCNPGRTDWQHQWGAERPEGPKVQVGDWEPDLLGYVPEVGDRHLYPMVPQTRKATELLRTMGAEGEMVFLSEYGTGSLFNVVTELRGLQVAGAPANLAEPVLMASMNERFLADFDRFGLGAVYAFPEDLLEASYRAHAAYRLTDLSLIRSNPHLVGHNITGMLDHAVSGEGLWSFADRVFKPGIVDAVSDGLAPLRWCVRLDPEHSVVGSPVRLDVVLADEGVLAPGSYPGSIRVMGPDGPEWEQRITVEVPQPRASRLVHPVLSVDLPAEWPAGRHHVALSLDDGAAPRGRTAAFLRTEPVGRLSIRRPVVVDPAETRLRAWLQAAGVDVHDELTDPPTDSSQPPVILVGSEAPLSAQSWAATRDAVHAGATLALLDAAASVRSDAWQVDPLLPLEVDETNDWLYHTETFALPHPAFAGVAAPGLLDWSYFGQTIPRTRLLCPTSADDVAVVQIGIGMPVPGGYVSGYALAGWAVGRGRMIASTMRLVEWLGEEAAAAQLLAGLLTFAGS